MIATIKHLDEPQRAAFGFVPGAFTEEVERRWYRALLHSCKADSECDIGGHHLIEMGFWDQQKLAGMGASPSQPRREASRPQTRLKISVPLVPPKPKLFFTACSIFMSRAVFAQ